MPDPRFFAVHGPFTVAQLAEIGQAMLGGGADAGRLIRDVAALDIAGPDDLSFIDNPRYVGVFRESRAGACVVHPDRADMAPPEMVLLLSPTPYLSYARMAGAFYPPAEPSPAIDRSATIDPTAAIGADTRIAAGVVVGEKAQIGRRCTVAANAVIGPSVVIGDDCHVGAGASIHYCLMGDRVRVFAGARIGEAGFGFASAGADGYVTVPQLGRVLVEDDVEIGANATIDRGSGPDTVIGAGCRIDNLVQIGHNVRLGRHCVIVAQTGISGSTMLEDFVVTGGQVGLTGHLTIGKGAQIGAQSGVMRDLPAGARVLGSPAIPVRQRMRHLAILGQLAKKKADKDG